MHWSLYGYNVVLIPDSSICLTHSFGGSFTFMVVFSFFDWRHLVVIDVGFLLFSLSTSKSGLSIWFLLLRKNFCFSGTNKNRTAAIPIYDSWSVESTMSLFQGKYETPHPRPSNRSRHSLAIFVRNPGHTTDQFVYCLVAAVLCDQQPIWPRAHHSLPNTAKA